MTETEARQVLLLQAHETGPETALWTAQDRAWATEQALASAGEGAPPERFVLTRARLALTRLLPRDAALQPWLQQRPAYAAWGALGAAGGVLLGMAADQLGPPQHVNLLAPAVWAVVAWNLVVYAWTVLSWWPRAGGGPGWHGALARWAAARAVATAPRLAGLREAWAAQAAPLVLARVSAVLHLAALGLAAGLLAGLYLRGLVLDYRAGWQSTFLVAPQVQALLDTLLGPAARLTGVAVPAVAPLQVGPGQAAQASAAPWIHLYAATLALAVLLPRAGLLALAALRAGRLARHFPLALDTPYFEGLHPLMRPGRSRRLVLLWVDDGAPGPRTLLGQTVPQPLAAPLRLLASAEGDELWLEPPPAEATAGAALPVTVPAAAAPPAPPAPDASAWSRWAGAAFGRVLGRGTPHWTEALHGRIDAVLWWPAAPAGSASAATAATGAPRPAWLAELARPVLDWPAALAEGTAAADASARDLPVPLDPWLPDRAGLCRLITTLAGDGRAQRLALAWQATQRERLARSAAVLAEGLAQTALARVPVAEARLWGRGDAGERAQTELASRLARDAAALATRLAAVHGLAAAPAALRAAPAPGTGHVPEGAAAVLGGVASGALVGLKADLASGGLTLGLGLVGGALIGALTGAGVARGVNVVRGSDGAFVAWPPAALEQITAGAALDALAMQAAAHGQPFAEAAAQAAVHAAAAPHKAALDDAWAQAQGLRRQRPLGAAADAQVTADAADGADLSTARESPSEPQPEPQPDPDAQALAARLQPVLAALLREALARLAAAPPPPTATPAPGPRAAAFPTADNPPP